jgi:hypothetical protein
MEVSGPALIGCTNSIRGTSVGTSPDVFAEVVDPDSTATAKIRAAIARALRVTALLFIDYLLLLSTLKFTGLIPA